MTLSDPLSGQCCSAEAPLTRELACYKGGHLPRCREAVATAIVQHLIDQKESLPHAALLPWIEANFGMAERSAHRFIEVAAAFEVKPVAGF